MQRKRRGGINKAVISHDPAVGSCYGNDRISGLGRIVEDRRDVKRMGAWKRFMQEEDGMGVVEVILIIVVLVAMVLISKNRFLHWSRQSGQPLTGMRRKYIRRKQRQEENMNNKGRIVVFISMITAVMLVLITLVIQVVILSAAKSKM